MTTAAHDADERRMAARALLANPVLTAYRHTEEFALVRRHASALKPAFGRLLGYALVVESGFARLIKAPLPAQAPVRPARRSSGSEFTPRTYTYLALVCAGLLARDVGEQVLLSQLVEQIRADAVTAGITIDDTLAERRDLVAAIDLLLAWGVLTETDGTVTAWGERREEALLTVTRGLLPHLVFRPLHPLDRPDLLWVADPDEPEQPRRTLRRKLVENPLVHRGDLSDAERDVLRRERTELTRVLEESFGLTLEVRAEGALAYDADAQLTDVVFPGTGTVRQAALLLIDALIEALQPSPGTEVTLDGRTLPGVLAPWHVVDDELGKLAQAHVGVWRTDVLDHPLQLRDEAADLLKAVGLCTVTGEGLVVHPAAARYRPAVRLAPPATRAKRRLDDDAQQFQAPLFTDGTDENGEPT
ncbi:TIGR02678 family protein [Nonomuraea sp. NPDC050783]|uniref:TIGR02678 family protein n=1 Tax=Nonomuraea sp. NPDC050783 TaxID=3154634 RepID=UPI003465AD06